MKRFILCCVSFIICLSVLCSCASQSEQKPQQTIAQTSAKGDDVCNLLLLGTDKTAGLSDVIMLASFNKSRRSASVLQIPRDTYAEYTEGSYKKLNGAASAIGARELCAFLSDSLSIPISYYVSVDLSALGEVVDMLGGVEVDIPFALDYEDPEQGLYIHLRKGKQILDGAHAQQFVRYRAGYAEGDIGRIDAQKIFLASFIESFKDRASVLGVGLMTFRLFDDIKTNLPITTMISLLGEAVSLESESIGLVTLPGASAVALRSGASYYVMSKVATHRLICERFGTSAEHCNIDMNGRFLNESYDEFRRIYSSDAEYTVYSVSSVRNGAIDIGRT